MVGRAPTWLNTPVLLEAIDRYDQGLLSRSIQLWLETLLEIDGLPPTPLRPDC